MEIEEIEEKTEVVLPDQLKNPPGWMKRALDPETEMTEARETIRTMTAPLDPNKPLGQWILFPSIREMEGQLMRADSEDEARGWAMEKADFLVFDNKDSAEFFSRRLSDMIGQARDTHAKDMRLMSDPEFQNYKELRGG